MKTTRTVDYYVCDFCGGDIGGYTNACRACGTHACYECEKTHFVHFPHGLHVQGSSDGYYCNKCNAAADDELHDAYQQLSFIRKEMDAVATSLYDKARRVEKRIKELLDD